MQSHDSDSGSECPKVILRDPVGIVEFPLALHLHDTIPSGVAVLQRYGVLVDREGFNVVPGRQQTQTARVVRVRLPTQLETDPSPDLEVRISGEPSLQGCSGEPDQQPWRKPLDHLTRKFVYPFRLHSRCPSGV